MSQVVITPISAGKIDVAIGGGTPITVGAAAPATIEISGEVGLLFSQAAQQAAADAASSATEAEHWANYTPGQPVPEGSGEFSAKHYAQQAATFDPANYVAKAGDTMTGDLMINEVTPALALTDGTDNARFILSGGITYLQGDALYFSGYAGVDVAAFKVRFGDSFEDVLHAGLIATKAEAQAGAENTKVMTPLRVAEAMTVGINAQTGTAYTLAATDANAVVTMDNVAANTVTVPAETSVNFDVGTVINIVQVGAGVTAITGAAGVTINGVAAGSATISGQWCAVSLLKIGADTWALSGAHGGVS